MMNQGTSPASRLVEEKSFRLLEGLKIKQSGNQTGGANV